MQPGQVGVSPSANFSRMQESQNDLPQHGMMTASVNSESHSGQSNAFGTIFLGFALAAAAFFACRRASFPSADVRYTENVPSTLSIAPCTDSSATVTSWLRGMPVDILENFRS